MLMRMLWLMSVMWLAESNVYGDELILPSSDGPPYYRSARFADSTIDVEERISSCMGSSNLATFFVHDDVLSDNSKQWRRKSAVPCVSCSRGEFHAFDSLAVDISDIDKDSSALLAGSFSCQSEMDLCVETKDGRFFQPLAAGVSVYPAPLCQGNDCWVGVLLDGGATLREVGGVGETYSGCDQIQHPRSGKRHSARSFRYLKLKALSCNSCRGPIEICSIPPGNVLRRSPTMTPSPSQFDSHGSLIPNLSGPFPPLKNQMEEETKIISYRPFSRSSSPLRRSLASSKRNSPPFRHPFKMMPPSRNPYRQTAAHGGASTSKRKFFILPSSNTNKAHS